jgi:hypothetical protein
MPFKQVSYTYLHMLACPYAAFLRYEAAIKGPLTHHLALGNAVHLALEKTYTPLGVITLDGAIGIYNKEYTRLTQEDNFFATYPQIKKAEKEGIEMLERYFAQMETGRISKEPLAVEQEFRLPIAGIDIVGKVDKVERDEQGLIVTDYKSGSRKPDDWFLRRNLQFTAYYWACKELYGEYPYKVQWHHLRTGEILTSVRDEFDIDQLVRIVTAAVEMQNMDMRYRIYHEQVCGWCDYRGPICDNPTLEQEILSKRV